MPLPLLVPFFWYASAAEFDAVRAASVDGELLSPTYAEWLERANKGLDELRAGGRTAFKVEVRAQEFLTWCRARSLNVDSHARTEYASLMAIEWYRREHPEG